MAAKQGMIDSFVKITGADENRAKFYLESSAWNLEMAMASFYEGDPDDDDDLVAVGQSINAHTGQSISPHRGQSLSPLIGQSISPHTGQSGTPASSQGRQDTSKGGTKRSSNTVNSRFATIGSMNAGADEDESSEEEGQAFYAGGSEHSGQQVLGPKKKKHVVEDLFKSAREHGAEEVGQEVPQPRAGPAFKGSGYRLGDTEGASSERIHGEPVMFHKKQIDCVLKLWKDGFSVDDGPLRDFHDPANKEFLAAISNGEVPQELIRAARGGEVNLNMEDHRQEQYVKPKVPLRAFTGEGHTLGSPAPNLVSPVRSSPAAVSGHTSSLTVDESRPSTTIQIRLMDGTRLVQKFNLTHKVSDIRRHIISSRPEYHATSFILQTTFPNRELTNESETIETAKLQNAVVVQRMK